MAFPLSLSLYLLTHTLSYAFLLHSCLLHLSVGCLCCGIWKRNALKFDGRQPRSSLWPGITRANTLYHRTQMARFARGPPSRCQSPSPKFVRMVSEAPSICKAYMINLNNWWYFDDTAKINKDGNAEKCKPIYKVDLKSSTTGWVPPSPFISCS